MKLKTKIASILGAAIMATGVAAPLGAQQSGEVPIDIQIGTAPEAGLTWTISQTSEFSDVPFSLQEQRSTGAITATITDTRGTRAGWALTVRGTDFVGQQTEDRIPVGNFAITQASLQVVAGQATPAPVANTFVMGTTQQTLVRAAQGSGNGRYSALFTGEITIPAAQVVDVYEATLTVSLDAAP